MKMVLAASCGIAAAALGAVALSAEPLKTSRTVSDVLSLAAGEGAGDRKPSEIKGVRIAQAASPAVEPGRPGADDPNGQAAPPAADAGRPAPADDPNGQPAPAGRSGQAAPAKRNAQVAADDWDGPGDDDDRRGDDDRDGVDDPY